jgi:hypothetical protein
MRNNRKLFEYKRVLKARDAYVAELENLSREVLEEHSKYLQDKIEYLNGQREEIKQSASIDPSISKVQLGHLNNEVGVLTRAARNLEDIPDVILERLKEESTNVIKVFQDPQHAMETPEGKLAADYVHHIYHNSREETQERYTELDKWYALGHEQAISQEGALERQYQLSLMPQSIKHAKWRFMIALADAVFDINFADSHPDRMDDNNLTLLSHLYSRLSQQERGADNPHMPQTHKLRHNPAIHSLHVVALADKIFHDAEKLINGRRTPEIEAKWRKIRDEVMLAALVHDCGEMDGELSQSIRVATMNEEQKIVFDKARNDAESKTFEKHLDVCRPALKRMDGEDQTSEPISDEEWKALKARYISAFELAEQTDSFVGRLIKTLERMQSQHDYLRFEGINGAPLLNSAENVNKEFSMNYVSKIYRDAPHNDSGLGKKAIEMLAMQAADPDERIIFTALANALKPEYQHLMEKTARAYGATYDPSSVNITWRKRTSNQGESQRAVG